MSSKENEAVYLIFALFEISHDLCIKNFQHENDTTRLAVMPFVSSARYLPSIRLSVFRNISRRRDSPIGLYFKLNLSNRWNES